MARYIDAVKNAEIISEKLNIPLFDLVDIFAEIPTADVVEVVRCKDCARCDYCFSEKAYDEEALEGWRCTFHKMWMKPNDYCSFGEKALKERENR